MGGPADERADPAGTEHWLESLPEEPPEPGHRRVPRTFRLGLRIDEPRGLKEAIYSRSNARCVAYQTSQWKELTRLLERVGNRKGLLVFDAVLAVTLKAAGVKYFHTRNVKDFEEFGYFETVDPLRSPEG